MRELILNSLLPMARRGLESESIPESEIDDYLNVIAERVLGLPPEMRVDKDKPFRDVPTGPPSK